MKLTVYLNTVLSGICIVLSFWENEFTASANYQETWLADLVRGVVLVLSMIQLILIHQYYLYSQKTRVAKGTVQSSSNDQCSETQI